MSRHYPSSKATRNGTGGPSQPDGRGHSSGILGVGRDGSTVAAVLHPGISSQMETARLGTLHQVPRHDNEREYKGTKMDVKVPK